MFSLFFSHASLRFTDTKRVNEILNDGKTFEILGKKVYPFPAHSSLLEDMPKIGKANNDATKAAAKLVKVCELNQLIQFC